MNLKAEELAALREQLQHLQDEMSESAGTRNSGSEIVELDQARVGRLSRMDAMQAQAMSQANDRRRTAMQAKIRAALARIDDGTYGLCRRCEQAVDPRRLAVDPTAVFCIDCAQKGQQ